jgi:putative transport protein
MTAVIDVLISNPLLYLFVIAAIGYPLGRIKVCGCSLGVAAVLFVGLAFSSLHPDLKLPEIIYVLGLALFVYTIGLTSGPGFVASLRREGLRDNLFAVAILLTAFLLTLLASAAINLKPTLRAGLFAGSLTNTPALAGILDTIKHYAPKANLDQLIAEPAIAYSIAYPMGVVGILLAILLAQKLWKIDYDLEIRGIREFASAGKPIVARTLRVTRATKETLGEIHSRNKWNVVFARIKHGEHLAVATEDKKVEAGDLLEIVGTEDELDLVSPFFGELSGEHIERDKSELEMRRIFVSNQDALGKKLKNLKIGQRFGAVVTRVRRGDMDMVVRDEVLLEPGDRVRVVCPRNRMAAVSAFFGDSYRAVSEVDILTFSLGLALGLLVGILPIPLPGGLTLRIGFAGGPLLAGLVLGAVERTGPLVWSIPYGANMTLRQTGIILFLAGIGTRAGYAFVSTFSQSGGMSIFLAGAAITFTTSMLTLAIGYKILKIPFAILTGMAAGLHTQPSALGFALEQAGNDLPNIGYSAVFPTATILKIILAQILITPYMVSLNF